MNGRNGMSDIDELIGSSLRERASHAPGRAPGMSGVRRRVRRRQQRHAVLAVAPMALMSAYFVTRERSTGVLPASGSSGQTAPLDTLADSMAPTSTMCGAPGSAYPDETGPRPVLSEEMMSAINAGEETLPEWFSTTTLAPCAPEPAPTSPPEATVTTVECIGAPGPCVPPYGPLGTTTTMRPSTAVPPSTGLPQTTTSVVVAP